MECTIAIISVANGTLQGPYFPYVGDTGLESLPVVATASFWQL